MDIEKMSLSQLKAAAYDEMAKMEQIKYNLSVLNQKISEKSKKNSEEPSEKS